MNNINILSEIDSISKFTNLKDELLFIKNEIIGSMMTKSSKYNLYNKLWNVFDKYNLNDLQFKLIGYKDYPSYMNFIYNSGMENDGLTDNCISILGVREIDNWALKGIFDCN